MMKTLDFILSEIGSHYREIGRRVIDPVSCCPVTPSMNACGLGVLLADW